MGERKLPLPDFLTLRNESGGTEQYYSVTCEYLPKEFEAVAEKQLNETAENRAKGLKSLREFLKKENLPDADDSILLMVLRSCKYNIKKSEPRLMKFLKVRRMLLEKVADLQLEKVEEIYKDKGIGILPYRDKHGRLIFYTRPEAMNDKSYSMDDVMLAGIASSLATIRYPLTSVAGLAYIGCNRFSSLSSYMALLKAMHQHMWTMLDLSFRIGSADINDEQFLTRWFYNIVRPFLSKKVLGRVTFNGPNRKNLRKHFHPDILPEEFTGNMGPLDHTFYLDLVLNDIKQMKAEYQALKDAAK